MGRADLVLGGRQGEWEREREREEEGEGERKGGRGSERETWSSVGKGEGQGEGGRGRGRERGREREGDLVLGGREGRGLGRAHSRGRPRISIWEKSERPPELKVNSSEAAPGDGGRAGRGQTWSSVGERDGASGGQVDGF